MRALLVCYFWPPTGGVAANRVLKLSKYIPVHGVEATVLTSANPSVPLIDNSLMRDIRPELEVLRARTLEPSYGVKAAAWKSSTTDKPSLRQRAVSTAASLFKSALVPDPQLLWQPDAQRVLAQRMLSSQADDVVFISGPPFSQFLLAPLIHLLRRKKTAVVLDYRDEWVTYRSTYEMMGKVGALIGDPMERTLIRFAHGVTTATEAFRQNLLEQFPFLDPDAVRAIPNGYDPDDYSDGLPSPTGDRFVITYAGTIFKLTSARGLLGAIRRLHRDDPELAKLLEVRFIGRIVDSEADAFEGMDDLGVVRMGFIPKAEVIPALAGSHMVGCFLDDVPGAERIYPGKVFELMYLRRPCLTLAPPGALADLATAHKIGPVIAPRDEVAIASCLAEQLRAFRDGTYKVTSEPHDIERYHRRAQAGEFTEVFRQALDRARS
ncbi:MAG: glycosyltransferase [Myxococcota bacterium]